MIPWILLVWWVGLIGALVLTVVILKEARLVLGTLRDLRVLADRTALAARGIAEHVSPIPELPSHLGNHEALLTAARRLRGAAEAFDRILQAKLGPSVIGRISARFTQWLSGRSGEARD